MAIRIRVDAPPPGRDPDNIKERWVGIELKALDSKLDLEWGLVYMVDGEAALRALAASGQDGNAANVWYREHRPWRLADGFEFKVVDCLPLSTD